MQIEAMERKRNEINAVSPHKIVSKADGRYHAPNCGCTVHKS